LEIESGESEPSKVKIFPLKKIFIFIIKIVGQGVFTKINSPDMKDLSHSVGKEETVKLEQKKDAHKSTMKSQMSGNLRQKDIMTGSFAGKQRGNSAQSRK